jgi:hypothetical protein
MNAQELADKFTAKIAVAAVEKNRQTEIAADNVEKRTADVEHCKRAMEQQVLPLCVPKTLSVLMTRWNRLSWRNDRAALFRSGRAGLAVQVEGAASS